ncbi:hypothetical protein F9288_15190 [Sphingomonas sp. CL5.1]|uniref:CC_3452 family protein n=1 Tax=Sphingomonas sp. CL5.1 TaxID=2653203 RepID=UPI0015839182|nr:hypothetical protein [Sphingomonas sp. CL5.1]QKS00816.1 hypothetical protein F9288_15190 [Sphingomonas sp. CL5.1]
MIAAMLTSAAFLASAGASAQASGGYFVATPVATATKDVVMTRETPWNLHDGVYVAGKAPLREMAACQMMARNVGALSAFTVAGKAFDEAALGECNTKARGGAAAKVASNQPR